jgi:hypothetical protein
MGDPSIPGASGRTQNPSTLIPNYSVYFESPNSLAANKVQLHTPKQMAKSEFKVELLKRQYICLAEVKICLFEQICAKNVIHTLPNLSWIRKV